MTQVYTVLKLLLPECDGNRQNDQILPLILHNIRSGICNHFDHDSLLSCEMAVSWIPSANCNKKSVKLSSFNKLYTSLRLNILFSMYAA